MAHASTLLLPDCPSETLGAGIDIVGGFRLPPEQRGKELLEDEEVVNLYVGRLS